MGFQYGYKEFLLMKNPYGFQENFVWYQLPAIFWLIMIFVLSSIPDLTGPDLQFELQDKFYHFLFYLIFGLLIGRAFYFQSRYRVLKDKYLVIGIIFGVLYGVSDEVHQFYVPGRMMSSWDMLADGLGVIAGILIFQKRESFRKIFQLFKTNR